MLNLTELGWNSPLYFYRSGSIMTLVNNFTTTQTGATFSGSPKFRDFIINQNTCQHNRPQRQEQGQVNLSLDLPPVPIDNFYGRTSLEESFVDTLSQHLNPREPSTETDYVETRKSCVCWAIVGPAGVGKTEFVKRTLQTLKNRMRKENKDVDCIWIPRNGIEGAFHGVATALPSTKARRLMGLQHAQKINAIYKILCSKPTIIIFDNVISKKEVLQFCPTAALESGEKYYAPVIIVTTRNRSNCWTTGWQHFHLETLPLFLEEESVKCCEHLLSPHKSEINNPQLFFPEVAREICGHLPVVLQQAKTFLMEVLDENSNFHEDELIIQKFKDKELKFLKTFPYRTGFEYDSMNFFNTWECTLDILCKNPEFTPRILSVLSCLCAESIPKDLLANITSIVAEITVQQVKEGLTLLHEYCLIETSQCREFITMHRLIQTVIFAKLGGSTLWLLTRVMFAVKKLHEHHHTDPEDCNYCIQEKHLNRKMERIKD